MRAEYNPVRLAGGYATDEVALGHEPFDARNRWSGSSDRDRRQEKFPKDIREAVSDRGGGVRSRGEAA